MGGELSQIMNIVAVVVMILFPNPYIFGRISQEMQELTT